MPAPDTLRLKFANPGLSAPRNRLKRRRIALCLAFGAIGFSPIAALTLTVGGLWSLPIGSLVLMVPAVVMGIALGSTHQSYGRHAVYGLTAGLIAVLVYDLVRWTFIPNIGGWLDGTG